MPVVGITQGIQAVIAYYSGHKQETKEQKTIRLTIFYTVLYGCIGTVFVFLFGNKILGIFSSSDAILAQSTAVLKIIFLTFPVIGIFYTILTLLEVTGHEIKAVILTLLRQVFLLLPLVYLLPNLFPQLKNAVFWAVPISDLYYGNITPCEQQMIPGSELKRAVDRVAKCEEQLAEFLDEEEKHILTRLTRSQQEANSITATENFILGFRLGVRLMAECMDNNDGDINCGGE